MKKIILAFLLTSSFFVYSQNNTKHFFRNELKMDAFDLAFFTAFDIGYERVFKEKTSIGISMFINFNPEETYYEKFAITPFYRFYFFNNLEKGNNGYYFEIFSKFASGRNLELQYTSANLSTDYFDVNLGASVGKKWIHEGGFVLEISLGGGRNLGLDSNSPEFAFRGGVSIGYRF